MKRVLLVAYAFPPEPLPGAQRPGYLARYLPACGWDVTVLTHSAQTPPFPARIVRAGESSAAQTRRPSFRAVAQTGRLRALLRAVKDVVLFPDDLAPWIPRAVRQGLRVLRQERYDAIVTTALPSSVHVVGAILSAATRTPWIADYRDAWSGNPYFHRGRLARAMHKSAECLFVGRAAEITTISAPLASHLQGVHRRAVTVIENAYDPAEWDAIQDERPQSFDLVYTGTMYAGKRSAAVLFDALKQLRDEGHPSASAVRVHFYGEGNSSVIDEARQASVEELVHLHGTVPRAQAMRAQRRAAGLLIFLSTDPSTVKERGSKYLEYAGARRPMLVFGPHGSALREVVERAALGWFAADAAMAKNAVAALYERYRSGKYEAVPDADALPSAMDLARLFAGCLDGISRDAGPRDEHLLYTDS